MATEPKTTGPENLPPNRPDVISLLHLRLRLPYPLYPCHYRLCTAVRAARCGDSYWCIRSTVEPCRPSPPPLLKPPRLCQQKSHRRLPVIVLTAPAVHQRHKRCFRGTSRNGPNDTRLRARRGAVTTTGSGGPDLSAPTIPKRYTRNRRYLYSDFLTHGSIRPRMCKLMLA